jgi:glycosyltransferase involved in cell wall biosynthesis
MPDVVLPVLNEGEALPAVISAMPSGYRPLVVDNGSTDGSAQIARELGVQVVHEPRPGFGSACHAGLLSATDDVVCFMDCDGSLDPADLVTVAEPVCSGEAELIVCERVPDRGAWPLHARLLNRALTFEVRRRTGLGVRDIGPMRAARRTDLLGLRISDRGFGWPLEMVLRAATAGWRIATVPVPYRARTGRSKVTGTVRGTVRAVRDMAMVLR